MCKIRKAGKADIPRIKYIVKSVLQEYGLGYDEADNDTDLSDINYHYHDNNGYFGVIEYNHLIWGTLGIYRLNEKQCEIRKMYYLKEIRGKGLGNRAIEFLIKKASSLSYKEIIILTHSKLKEANALYRKYNFRPTNYEILPKRCDTALKLNISDSE